MNSRVRALVWEELRVGGPIAAACLAVGLLMILEMHADSFLGSNWPRAGSSVLGVALGAPLMCGLLLVLNIRNSGHLGGGFSRRILWLPVGTVTAVTVAFWVRLSELLVLVLALKLSCWVLYRNGPGWDAVLLVLGAYAFIQMFDWMRAVLSWPLTALFGIAFALVVQFTGLLEWWDCLTRPTAVLAPSPLVVMGWIALAFAVSMALVIWTRRGERFTLWQGGSVGKTAVKADASAAPVRPFGSARAAHLWYQLRQNGFLLPQMTVSFWMGATALYWLIDFYMDGRPDKTGVVGWFFSARSYFFVTQLMPFVSLLCAAAGWRLVVGLGERRRGRQPLAWTSRLPMPRAVAARARMNAAGVNLALTLAVVTVAYLAAYLLPDHSLAARLFASVLAGGEASLREVLMALLGPVLLFGLLAWIIMSLPASLFLLCMGWVACTGLLALGGYNIVYFFPHGQGLKDALDLIVFPFTVWFLGLAPVVMLINLFVLAWKGWIRRGSALLCLALWAGLTLALYPFLAHLPREASQLALVYCAGLAAMAVLGWPERVIASAGGLRGLIHPENPEQHLRFSVKRAGFCAPDFNPDFLVKGYVPVRTPWKRKMAQALALLAVFVFVAWLRWPAPPKMTEALHAQGLPATLEEGNEWYKAVPASENRANRYLETIALRTKLCGEWMKEAADNPSLQAAIKATKAKDALDNVVVQGNAKVKRAEPIPAAVWMTTRDYAAAVSDPVSGKLDEAARSGLRGSRYPIDLRQGFGVLLPHLAELRTLGRELSVKAWVAAVERRPEDAATALMDLFPLANSLEGEPLLISQLVRIAIHGIAVDGLQTVMNLIELPDSVLAQLQDGFRQALPPLKDGPFLSRAMAGEESVALSYGRTIADVGSYQTIWTNHGADTKRVPTAMMLRGVLVYIGSDLLGMDRTERMVTQRLNAASREIALEAAKTGGLPYADKLYDTTLQKMSYHAPVAYILMPGLARAYEAEWRIRTQFDLACTAMAVDRYRLAKGHLPERLEELVPAYLERVPTDPWNNTKTLSYRLKENGEFVVYSFGPNKTDQKGEEVKDNWWTNGDITFTVAPPELRNRPQVAGEASGAGV